MSPVTLVRVFHSCAGLELAAPAEGEPRTSPPSRRQPRATTLDRIDVVTQISSIRLDQLYTNELALRGFHPSTWNSRCRAAQWREPEGVIHHREKCHLARLPLVEPAKSYHLGPRATRPP